MAIYAYENLSLQIVDDTSKPQKPNPLPLYDDEGNRVGEIPAIEMNEQRPTIEHIARINGDWILPEPRHDEQSDEVPNDTGTQTENTS